MDIGTTGCVRGLLKNAEKQVDSGRRSLYDLAPNTAPWACRGHKNREQVAERDREAKGIGEG